MFSRKTIQFLKELNDNNNRDWFAANKDRYESLVREPALAYIEAMAQPMAKVSPQVVVSAKKTGGSLMRVYRDTRFGHDKTPYKTNIGIQFRHARGKDVHAPGFYLHIEPNEVFMGAGIWKPESSTLGAVRALMDDDPARWKKLVRKVCQADGFALAGDSLMRPPKGYSADHPLVDDLKRKDFLVSQSLPVGAIYKPDFVATTAREFKRAAAFVGYICEADDLDF